LETLYFGANSKRFLCEWVLGSRIGKRHDIKGSSTKDDGIHRVLGLLKEVRKEL
jgi:hypothetical protein